MIHKVSDTIPDLLAPRVEAAVAWFNNSPDAAGNTFTATGLPDADQALSGAEELKLVLCGGDRCEQRTFRVSGSHDHWSVQPSYTTVSQQGRPQADLDPPPGARLSWVDTVMSQHAFVVLLFYRGFW